ncbi:hypothetical protein [Thermosipho atlanticus]|uniref:hypothetical protein n=1 Tax=Thermosipho atlanticus TaxID=238991 RepID=UPI00093522CC|nr:hypothetical protein [Thermosipho atlanticus]
MKRWLLLCILIISVLTFSGSFVIFDNTFVLENSPVLFSVSENSFGVGFLYSTSTVNYSETKIGFFTIRKPSEKESLDFSVMVGSMYGTYISITYEKLSFPIFEKRLDFFVTNKFSFMSTSSKAFYAIGPLLLNFESRSLKRANGIGYSFSRYFAKYQEFSGYYVRVNEDNLIGYFYPLDASLEQGLLVGLGTKDFSQLYLNVGFRQYFNAADFRGFTFAYVYAETLDLSKIRYYSGIKFLAPLKGDLIVWDGKVSFGINW